MKKIKISAISYLNTVPFIYGISNSDISKYIELSFDTPSVCAERLLRKDVDLGIVPVAVIPKIKEAKIISDFCIGANGPVRTVAICSTSPINEIKNLYLDSDSKTSSALAQFLIQNYWRQPVTFKKLNSINDIDLSLSKTGYVLIGDKVFEAEKSFQYKYDLAEAWINFKKLPFVFAAWATVSPLPSEFIDDFNNALDFGIKNIENAIDSNPLKISRDEALSYLRENINYDFDTYKKKALELYWSLALSYVEL